MNLGRAHGRATMPATRTDLEALQYDLANTNLDLQVDTILIRIPDVGLVLPMTSVFKSAGNVDPADTVVDLHPGRHTFWNLHHQWANASSDSGREITLYRKDDGALTGAGRHVQTLDMEAGQIYRCLTGADV